MFVMASIQRFTVERHVFAQLKRGVDSDAGLRQEIEYALDQLLGRFATSVRENRFVVGGALEVILTAAFVLRVLMQKMSESARNASTYAFPTAASP